MRIIVSFRQQQITVSQHKGHDNQRYLGIDCQQIFFRLKDRKYVKNILRMRTLKLR